jgi:Zn-dependent protease with chaperone function
MGRTLLRVRNVLKSWALLFGLCALLGFVPLLIGNYRLLSIFLFCALLLAGAGYFYIDRIALGPLAAALVHLFLSPKREFLADLGAAELCNSPHGLADALIRLEQTSELVEFQASPATEPLYTINPFAEEGLAALFITHPPVAERVRRLRALDPTWREKLRAA